MREEQTPETKGMGHGDEAVQCMGPVLSGEEAWGLGVRAGGPSRGRVRAPPG